MNETLLSKLAQQLEPGKQLDRLLAEHVMGWQTVMHDGELWWSSYDDQAFAFKKELLADLWHPSTDLSCALRLIEGAKEGLTRDYDGLFFRTLVSIDHPSRWEITLAEDMMGPLDSVWALTFPLALSRAAAAWALRKEVARDLKQCRENELSRQAPPPPPIEIKGKPASETLLEERQG